MTLGFVGIADGWMRAVCLVFPDGTVRWLEDGSLVEAEVRAWWVDHPEFEGTGASMGAVQVQMKRETFLAIPATRKPA